MFLFKSQCARHGVTPQLMYLGCKVRKIPAIIKLMIIKSLIIMYKCYAKSPHNFKIYVEERVNYNPFISPSNLYSSTSYSVLEFLLTCTRVSPYSYWSTPLFKRRAYWGTISQSACHHVMHQKNGREFPCHLIIRLARRAWR